MIFKNQNFDQFEPKTQNSDFNQQKFDQFEPYNENVDHFESKNRNIDLKTIILTNLN